MSIFTGFKKKKKNHDSVNPEQLNDLGGVEKEMIKGIVELSETLVKEIMVPRIDVVFIKHDIKEDTMINKMIDSGHSRFPLYEDTIDNVIGILYIKDLFKQTVSGDSFDIVKIARKPYFVPETMKLDMLLKELKQRCVHIAIAVDEYGGISGIVSMEDIIEEIVGEIQDEFDKNEPEDILEVETGVFLCDSRVDLEEINKEIDLNLPEDEFETLGGFVFDLFGKIPIQNEKITFEDVDFIIQKVDGHKIETVKVIKRGKLNEKRISK